MTKIYSPNSTPDTSNLDNSKEENLQTDKKKKLVFSGLTPEQKDKVLKGGMVAGSIGLAAGVITILTSADTPDDAPHSDTDGELIHDEAPVATNVNDDMTFAEAFSNARVEVGAGGVFEWHDQTFNTFYKEEWDSLSSDQKNEYTSSINGNSSASEHNIAAADPISVPTDMEVAEGVSDDMSFEEAFSEAREEIGADGVFVWHGQTYSTHTAGELDAMDDSAHHDYVHHIESNSTPDTIIVEDNFDQGYANDYPEVNVHDISLDDPEILEVDIDGDGKTDVVALDYDHSGYADVIAVDEDGNQVPDHYVLDTDSNDQLDTVVEDRNEDGIDQTDNVIALEETEMPMHREDFLDPHHTSEGDEHDIASSDDHDYNEDIDDNFEADDFLA